MDRQHTNKGEVGTSHNSRISFILRENFPCFPAFYGLARVRLSNLELRLQVQERLEDRYNGTRVDGDVLNFVMIAK